MSSKSGVLYIGSTDNLQRRVYEHKHGLFARFTKKYRCTRLIYVEEFDTPGSMVARERQLKGWSRGKKLALARAQNPEMVDHGARKTARDPSTPAASAQDDGQRDLDCSHRKSGSRRLKSSRAGEHRDLPGVRFCG
jgi:putative endonuclease